MLVHYRMLVHSTVRIRVQYNNTGTSSLQGRPVVFNYAREYRALEGWFKYTDPALLCDLIVRALVIKITLLDRLTVFNLFLAILRKNFPCRFVIPR